MTEFSNPTRFPEEVFDLRAAPLGNAAEERHQALGNGKTLTLGNAGISRLDPEERASDSAYRANVFPDTVAISPLTPEPAAAARRLPRALVSYHDLRSRDVKGGSTMKAISSARASTGAR